jgi:hypothetical protein
VQAAICSALAVSAAVEVGFADPSLPESRAEQPVNASTATTNTAAVWRMVFLK